MAAPRRQNRSAAPAGRTAEKALLLVPPVSAPMLLEALQPPSAVVLELTAGSIVPAEQAGLQGPGTRPPAALVLRLTTATAYSLPVAHCVADRLRQWPGTPQTLLDPFELVLQEALANAIIHGNLGIPKLDRPNRAAMERMMERLGQRLVDPAFATRPIMVWLESNGQAVVLTVIDAGEGFAAPEPVPRALPATTTPSGRGIGLMRRLADSVVYRKGGREVTIAFDTARFAASAG